MAVAENLLKILRLSAAAHEGISESETNRTFPLRVRFGSAEFLKSRLGFGSVRLNFQKVSSGSVQFD